KEWLGLGVSALGLVEASEVVQALCDIGMRGPERLLPDVQCADVQRLGLGVLAVVLVDLGEGVPAGRDVGMHRSQHLFAKCQRPLRERHGIAKLTLPRELPDQLVELLGFLERYLRTRSPRWRLCAAAGRASGENRGDNHYADGSNHDSPLVGKESAGFVATP